MGKLDIHNCIIAVQEGSKNSGDFGMILIIRWLDERYDIFVLVFQAHSTQMKPMKHLLRDACNVLHHAFLLGNYTLQDCMAQNIFHAGHGGPNAADFVRQNLFDSLVKNTNLITDVKTAFGERVLLLLLCLPAYSEARLSLHNSSMS